MWQQGADRNPREEKSRDRAPGSSTVLAGDLAQAALRLQQQFPGIRIEGSLGAHDDAFWRSSVRRGGAPLSVDDLLTSLLGLLTGGQREGVTVKFFSEGTAAVDGQSGPGRSEGVRLIVNTTAPLSQTDPLKRPFSLVQVYRPDADRLVIHLEAVVAPQHGRQYVQLLFAHARELGAARFTLTASMIGGSQEGVFAWARYGFVPRQEDWDDMRRSGLAVLDGDPEPLRPHRTELRDTLLDPSPKALRRLVHHSWKWQGATVGFLNSTLVSHVSWKGELDLADDAGCRWLQAYAGLPRASEHLETFTALLPAPSPHPSAPPPVPQAQPPAEEETEEDGNPLDLTDDQLVSALAEQIRTQEATLDELVEEYGRKRPDIVQRVRAALGQ